jgi:16S rRNA (adenine1518-N6/adenine1519-N6)-dimethyltransferase
MKIALKRRYGQHFLKDAGVLNRIISLIQPSPQDLMIEIGAGDGALAGRLAPRVGRLIAVEIDRDHIPTLTEALAPFPGAEIIAVDILKTDLASLISSHLDSGLRLRIVGNLPYNIGTAIIEKLLSEPFPIEDMIFMLQYEVSARIAAAPGSEDYGYFSVFCQHYCEVKLGFKVSPACFVPRPKVQSALITMRPRPGVSNAAANSSFLAIAGAAFAYRRKKLANSLRRDPRIGPITGALLSEAGIDGSRRAEELSLQEYECMASILHKKCSVL